LSKDSEICYGGGNNGFVYVWLVNTGKLIGKFKAANKPIKMMYLYERDRKLCISLYDSKLHLWDLEEILIKFFGSQEIGDSYSPFRIIDINNSQLIDIQQLDTRDNLIASCSVDKTLYITDLLQEKVVQKFSFEVPVCVLSFDSEGNCYLYTKT